MSLIVRIVGLASGRPSAIDGAYLISCDVDAYDGRGLIDTTDDPARARVFEGFTEAATYWARASTVDPIRPDGKPNRPLTAYSIETIQIDGEPT